jgi:hypothetical protein
MMTDPYRRLAAVLWFLPREGLEDLLNIAENIVAEEFKASLEE